MTAWPSPRIEDKVARGVPLERGRESTLWELPLCFELDDWVHFQFNFDPYRKGGATPSDVLEIWQAELDWMDANVDGGVLTRAAMHPQVIERGHRVAMLGAFMDAAWKPASASSAWATSRRRSSSRKTRGRRLPALEEDVVRMDRIPPVLEDPETAVTVAAEDDRRLLELAQLVHLDAPEVVAVLVDAIDLFQAVGPVLDHAHARVVRQVGGVALERVDRHLVDREIAEPGRERAGS